MSSTLIIRRRTGQEQALVVAPPRIKGTPRTPEQLERRRKRRMKNALNEAYKANLRGRATKAELMVREYLKRIGFKRVIFQKGFYSPFHIIADFYFPRRKLILEIDGGYHLKQQEKDRHRDQMFWRKRGIRTVRVTNEDVYSGRFKEVLDKEGINKAVEKFEEFNPSLKWIS